MTLISKAITGFGLLLLAHACYSAHEHSALQSVISSSKSQDPLFTSTTASGSVATTLPLDISIETVFGLVVVCIGLVISMPELKPIVWRVWAGNIERNGAGGSGEDNKDLVGNPFRALESRPSFVDVRRQRMDFAEWVKTGGSLKGSTELMKS